MDRTVKQLLMVIGAEFFVIGVCLVVFSAYRASHPRTIQDERVEVHQNTIPLDVRTWLRSQEVPAPTILPKSIRVPILMYHYVEYVKEKGDTIRQSLDTTPYTLEQQIMTLQNAGYVFMTNRELTDVLDGGRMLPQKAILLTFDDGYRDFYTDVYPILKKYHVKATEYLIAGWTGYPNNMTEAQIKEIANDELVEFGTHTVHHMWLKNLAPKALTYEIAESKKILETLIGKPVVSFAYPYGAFDVAAIQAVYAAGFTSAVSTIPGADQLQIHRYFLYRLRPGGRTGEALISWLDQVKDAEISFLNTSVK